MDAKPSHAGPLRSQRAKSLLARAKALLEEEPIRQARRALEADDARTVQEQRELTQISAPPFGETARARRMAELLRGAGIRDVETDEIGNVLAWLPAPRGAAAGRRPLVLSAHLDTVFPEDTDVRVREDGDRLVGPGISDDGRGLTALVAVARVLTRFHLPFTRPVVLAATVGEEGAGDLRGMRHLFRKAGPLAEAAAFVSLDGAGLARIVTTGLGSRRYRVTVSGPGGHSWVNWGNPNPIHGLGSAVAGWAALELPADPQATLTVARWGGGFSINAIPQEAWVELELRCASETVLRRLEKKVEGILASALEAARDRAASGAEGLRSEVQCIGTRPAGATDPGEGLVRAAEAATRALGAVPELAASSTDSNIPMSTGIPAITMGAGGEAGDAHTPGEWYRNVQGPDGILRALLTLVLADEVSEA